MTHNDADMMSECEQMARRYAEDVKTAIGQYQNGMDEEETDAPGLFDPLDIEYRVDNEANYRSVCIALAIGGPNVYLDTGSKMVEVYWGGKEARWGVSFEACDAVDAIYEEYYECVRY